MQRASLNNLSPRMKTLCMLRWTIFSLLTCNFTELSRLHVKPKLIIHPYSLRPRWKTRFTLIKKRIHLFQAVHRGSPLSGICIHAVTAFNREGKWWERLKSAIKITLQTNMPLRTLHSLKFHRAPIKIPENAPEQLSAAEHGEFLSFYFSV